MGEEFASVAGTRLLVYRSFVWDLAICTWFHVLFFFDPSPFSLCLHLLLLVMITLTTVCSKGEGRWEKEGEMENRECSVF